MNSCPDCGGEYEKLGSHLTQSDCEYPDLTDRQREIITGTLMGDADIRNDPGTSKPCYRLRTIQPDYIEYVGDQLQPHTSSITVAIERDEYDDVWGVRTIRSPVFNEFRAWYDEKTPVYPDDIELTPVVMKHWFACDGTREEYDAASIKTVNEATSQEKIGAMFERAGIDVGGLHQYTSNGEEKCNIHFGVDEAEELWEYMGEPVPGYEYKWPDRFT